MKSFILFILTFSLISQSLKSQNWTGNVSSDWNNAANWSSAPANGTAKTINPVNYTGAAQHPVINSNSAFNSSTIAILNGGQITVNANVSTTGNFELADPGSLVIVNNGTLQVGNRLIIDLGAQMTMNDGNVNVSQRFITGESSITTINNGNIVAGQRFLLDMGGIVYFHNGNITVGATMALADGSVSNSCLFHMTGGTLTVNGELALENESGIFEPVFRMDGGTLNLTGDLIWFGAAPGSGTPKVFFNGGTANITGLIQNFPLSTVNMYLKVDGNAVLNFSGSLIENLYAADSIVQSGNSLIHFTGSNTIMNSGVFYSDAGLINVAGTSNLQGSGSYQFHHLTIEPQGVMNHQNPQIVSASGNITKNGLFHSNLNTFELNGWQLQTLTGAGSYVFHNITIENTSQEGIVFQIPVNVNNHLQLNNGIIHTSASSLLEMADNSTAGGGSNTSHVSGPMTKTGDNAFTFPVGKNNKIMQVAMSAPGLPSNKFLAEYFNDSYSTLNPVVAPMNAVSNIEYWNLEQLSGTSVLNIGLSWNTALESAITDCNELTIAYRNNTEWIHIPSFASGICSGSGNGSTTSISGVSNFGIFTFGFFSGVTSQNITICSGDSLVVGNSVYYSTGHYMDVLTDATLNDSIVITYLVVINPDPGVSLSGLTLQSNNVSADTYQWVDCNNAYLPLPGETNPVFTPTVSGTYGLMVTEQGCSAVSACFNFLFDEPAICIGDSFFVGNNVYTTPGTYIDVVQIPQFNDSIIVITNLSVFSPDVSVSLSGIVLESNNLNADSYQWVDCNNAYLPLPGETNPVFTPTVSGTYGLMVTEQGCSAVSACFNFLFDEPAICIGDSFFVGNNVYTTPGTYIDVVQIPQFNDSIIVITNLSVFSPDVSVSVFGTVLHGNNLYADSYQWVDCNNNFTAIPGETNLVFSPAVNGSYALILSENGCTDTSECYQITTVDILEVESAKSLNIFPNPFHDEIRISFSEQTDNYTIFIFDLKGSELFKGNYSESTAEVLLKFNPLPGLYYLKYADETTEKFVKIVKY
jgi:hypothetical protein